MRRLLTIVMDIILLALLVCSLLAVWGLRSVNSHEDVPATVRVYQGQVSIIDSNGKTEQEGGGVLTLNVGQTIRVDNGADVFLFFADGSVSHINGPAELVLDQSKRTIKKPAILTTVNSKLFDKSSPPPAESKVAIKAQVLSGQIVTKASAANAKNVYFEILGPGVVITPTAASFAITVPDKGDVAIEVGQGTVAVGLVSLQGDYIVPIVIPQLESNKGIAVPLIPPDKTSASDVVRMLKKVDASIPDFQAGLANVSSQGIDFRQVTDAGILHYVGERMDGKLLVPAPPIAIQNVDNTKFIEESFVVPGMATAIVTDQMIADELPGGTKVHIVPGGIAQMEYGGMTYVVSIQIVDGRPSISGLPFGVDPPQIEDAVKTATGTQEVPVLLGFVSTEGQATVTYATDITVNELTDLAEAGPVPDSLPHTAPYFRSIPTPREISTDWKVVGSNAFIAALITLAVTLLAASTKDVLVENEARIARIYAPVSRKLQEVWKGLTPVGKVLRWFRPSSFTLGVWLIFIIAAIYTFLAVGKSFLGPNGLTIFLIMGLTSGFMALFIPWAKALAARQMKVDAKVGLFPGQLTVAAFTVAISRAFTFKPGLMLGLPVGLRISEKDLTDKHKFRIEIGVIVALAVLGALAWLLVFFLPQIGMQSWASGFFRTARGFVSGLQDWSLIIFAVAVQSVFFRLLFLPKNSSWELLKKHKVIWLIGIAFAAFAFLHSQLNKEKTINDLTPNMYATLAFAAAMAGLALVYKLKKKKTGEKAP